LAWTPADNVFSDLLSVNGTIPQEASWRDLLGEPARTLEG
jgi:hypothetical protein